MIRFACPGCAASFTVGDEKAGKSGKCPKCQSQFVIPNTPTDSAPAPAKTAPAPAPAPAADPVEIQPCPKCGAKLSVMPSDIGLDIECPTCQTVFKALKDEPGGGSKPSRKLDDEVDDRPSKKGSRRGDDDEDDRPSKKKSRRGDDDEEEDDRPSKKGSRRGRDDEDEEDDRPSKRKSSRRGDEEEDDQPAKSKSSRRGDDDEEERPSKRGSRRGDDEDEEEDRTPKKRSRRDDDDEEDDDRPRKKSRGGKGGKEESKKLVAGLLALFLGGFGVHKFYLGYTTAGIIQIVLTFCTYVGAIIPLIEGIIYLTKSDKDFIDTYQRNEKQWF